MPACVLKFIMMQTLYTNCLNILAVITVWYSLKSIKISDPKYMTFHQHFGDFTSASFAFNWSHGHGAMLTVCSAEIHHNANTKQALMWRHYQSAGEMLYYTIFHVSTYLQEKWSLVGHFLCPNFIIRLWPFHDGFDLLGHVRIVLWLFEAIFEGCPSFPHFCVWWVAFSPFFNIFTCLDIRETNHISNDFNITFVIL